MHLVSLIDREITNKVYTIKSVFWTNCLKNVISVQTEINIKYYILKSLQGV